MVEVTAIIVGLKVLYSFDTKVLSLDNSHYLAAAFPVQKKKKYSEKSFIGLSETRVLLGHIYWKPSWGQSLFRPTANEDLGRFLPSIYLVYPDMESQIRLNEDSTGGDYSAFSFSDLSPRYPTCLTLTHRSIRIPLIHSGQQMGSAFFVLWLFHNLGFGKNLILDFILFSIWYYVSRVSFSVSLCVWLLIKELASFVQGWLGYGQVLCKLKCI